MSSNTAAAGRKGIAFKFARRRVPWSCCSEDLRSLPELTGLFVRTRITFKVSAARLQDLILSLIMTVIHQRERDIDSWRPP